MALWVFSASACGTYGFDDLRIVHSGTTAPVGEIDLESKENIRIEAGSGLLLLTEASGATQ
jgi:hypothetical protein